MDSNLIDDNENDNFQGKCIGHYRRNYCQSNHNLCFVNDQKLNISYLLSSLSYRKLTEKNYKFNS